MKKYIILESSSKINLESAVNEHLKKEWEISDSAFASVNHVTVFYQPMIKEVVNVNSEAFRDYSNPVLQASM